VMAHSRPPVPAFHRLAAVSPNVGSPSAPLRRKAQLNNMGTGTSAYVDMGSPLKRVKVLSRPPPERCDTVESPGAGSPVPAPAWGKENGEKENNFVVVERGAGESAALPMHKPALARKVSGGKPKPGAASSKSTLHSKNGAIASVALLQPALLRRTSDIVKRTQDMCLYSPR